MSQHFIHREHCEVCGGNNKTILISRDFTHPSIWDEFLLPYYQGRIDKSLVVGGKYEIARCNTCSFMWQTSIWNDTLLEKLYNEWYAEKSLDKKQKADLTLYARYAKEVYFIAKAFGKKPYQLHVLDYGMGWGYWCLMAKAFGYAVDGLELSKARIDFATANGLNVIGYEDLRPEKYNLITAEQTFEHIPNPLANLKSLVKSLKPGGIIRIWTPDSERKAADFASPTWKAAHDAFHPLEHINCFTHVSLKRLGEDAGLQLMPRPRLYDFEFSWKGWVKEWLNRGSYKTTPTHLYFRKL